MSENRKGTTVTVSVPNPLEATSEELLEALKAQKSGRSNGTERVEYVNSRDQKERRVCFGVSWAVEG